MGEFKEVYFEEYCPHCSHNKTEETDEPCNECLATPYNKYSHKPLNYDGQYTMPENKGEYKSIKKIKDYLYEIEYDSLNYEFANDHYNNGSDISGFKGCSSVRNGNWYGRNLDWTYDNTAEFVVRTPRIGRRYSSIGVSGALSRLTNDFVESGQYDNAYKLIPFQLQDGINEHGVVANMNVVPVENGTHNIGVPMFDISQRVCALTLVRFILDRFKTAHEAVQFIRDHVLVYFPRSLHRYGYETHIMIADKTDTYLLEFIGNRTEIVDISSRPYTTNFYEFGVRFNSDGTVYTPETQDEMHNAIGTNNITPHGSGLERFNYISQHYAGSNSKSGMRSLMNDLTYTRAYNTSSHPSNPYWYTEFVGQRDLTVIDRIEKYSEVVDIAGQMFLNRSRADGQTWHTVHSSVYNISDKKLYLITQEDGVEYEFALK